MEGSAAMAQTIAAPRLTAWQWDLMKSALLQGGKVPLQPSRGTDGEIKALVAGGYIDMKPGQRQFELTARGRAAVIVQRKRK